MFCSIKNKEKLSFSLINKCYIDLTIKNFFHLISIFNAFYDYLIFEIIDVILMLYYINMFTKNFNSELIKIEINSE